jgi:acetyl-CoA carboxylase biotin carboxyl carrier protein
MPEKEFVKHNLTAYNGLNFENVRATLIWTIPLGGLMALTEDEVIQILKMVEQSGFGELRLETADLKLLVRKKGYVVPAAQLDPEPGTSGAFSVAVHEPAKEGVAVPGGSDKPKKQMVSDQEGLVPIRSTMLGTVYLRPSPDAPHYAEVGSYVKKDDTICLIEVMKVFTAVKAGVSGYIAEVLVETNEMVEYGQPLFLVRPAAEPGGKKR